MYHYTTYEAHVIHAVAVKRINNGRKKKDDFIKFNVIVRNIKLNFKIMQKLMN